MAANRKASSRFHITIYECILFALAITVAVLSILYSTTSAKQQQQQQSFTQIWILPSNQANNSCAVLIGVHSFESTSVTYRIVITINGTQETTWPSTVLAPQQEWDRQVSLRPEATDSMYVEVRLYRPDKPGIVYRDVHLTLHSSKGGRNGQGQQCTA